MSLAPFARLESQVSVAVFRKLSNAIVSIDGGEDFGGIFDDDAAAGSVGPIGMATTQPTVLVPADKCPANPVGLPISINGKAYRIAESDPDGTDMRLMLEVVL
ncbi:hypothetical protein LZ683_07985 [Comamonas testosteroni]|uniref:head-tail joining protein n=1 Tax=Comamonas testosteroni TaxID=285 RepID=UPI0023AAE679|nr:hypothetical protein [Comamonas testosteroni]WEE79299.1 hypothetical protein LZ683_07985 [Comamonas testosteroni]